MSEQAANKNNKLIVVIILVAVVIISGLAAVIFLLLGKDEAPVDPVEKNLIGGQIQYEQGVIALNQEDLQKAFDEAVQKTKEGYITVDFNNRAESSDGKKFLCYLGNSVENTYDAYFNMYLDSTFSDQILLTGLIPPGSGIDNFTSEIDLDPGTYEAVLVLTQVEDDHSTIHSQTNLGITLVVNG
ncbi:MAG: hypothetical protein HDT47_00435 [Ruminococcaceae bacterium]|nr:hypothetical protein [Oscillospiraceae bacterium]